MKSKIFNVFILLLVCCGIQVKMNAQFYGVEQNSNGSYTIWMNGGSVTTNTQGQYNVSQNQGTYCIGCYATPVNGYSGVYYAPAPYGVSPYQQIQYAPPSGYSYGTVNGNAVYYFNSQNQFLGSVPFGPTNGSSYGVVGYTEGCGSCAQVAAQNQATSQWTPTFVSLFMAQGIAYQQQVIATMQEQMNQSYNQSNAYNYYYYYYALQQISGNGGTSPLPPPPPMPPPPPAQDMLTPSNPDPALLDADFNGNRTYVTPAGTPFILPPGAKVGGLLIDMDNYSNGALYSFHLPNGKRYMARESYWVNTNGSEPDFGGYFEFVNGNIDLTKPYPFIPSDYPATNGTTLNVVRLTDKNNPCQLVQEMVSYTVGPQVPTTIPGAGGGLQEQNTDIEYTTPLPGIPPRSVNTMCPSAGSGNNSGPDLEKYVHNNTMGGASRLSGALNTHFSKNTVKIYLYDCTTGTGQAKYTVTKDGVTTVPGGSQAAETNKFENGNFGPADEDIAIKGCLQNGKWQYETKFNRSKLSPKTAAIAQALPEIEAELKRQAEEETKKLKTMNMRSNGESITVDGESFSKRGMDIFESIAAIYDIGKDIINEGKMPEKIWDGGKRVNGTVLPEVAATHSKSSFQMGTILSGASDELIDQATGVVQLVKTGLEFARHPIKTATTIYNSVRSLDKEKIKQMISTVTGAQNMIDGGDRAKYQGGKYGVKVATIIIGGLGTLTKGVDLVEGAGKNVTDIQKFVPDGSVGHPSTAALKNAADNSKLVKVLDDKKLITKNVVNGEERLMTIEKGGDVFDSKVVNNMDEISDDVLKKADAGDIAQGSESAVLHNEMKTQPQKFKDGKDFEKRIVNDPNTKISVGNKAGIDLTSHTKLTQVQLKNSDGSYFIADEVYIKRNISTGKYEVVINETKLSNLAPFTENQNQFLLDLRNGKVDFELRNTKFNKPEYGDIPQGEILTIKSMVKTVGDGTVGGSPVFSKFNPATNSWQ